MKRTIGRGTKVIVANQKNIVNVLPKPHYKKKRDKDVLVNNRFYKGYSLIYLAVAYILILGIILGYIIF